MVPFQIHLFRNIASPSHGEVPTHASVWAERSNILYFILHCHPERQRRISYVRQRRNTCRDASATRAHAWSFPNSFGALLGMTRGGERGAQPREHPPKNISKRT